MLQAAVLVPHPVLGTPNGVPRRDGSAVVKRKTCSSCGRPGHDRRSCGRLYAASSTRAFDPWHDLEWEEHGAARRVVSEHPDGMTLEEVGKVLGVTRERVRQIEADALRKLRDGYGLGEAATVDGITVALVECQRCDLLFVRRGRATLCELCLDPPKIKARAPKPKPDRDPGIALTLIFDFR